jgi:hypothetical protein
MLDTFGYDMVWAFVLENRDGTKSQSTSQMHVETAVPLDISGTRSVQESEVRTNPRSNDSQS